MRDGRKRDAELAREGGGEGGNDEEQSEGERGWDGLGGVFLF